MENLNTLVGPIQEVRIPTMAIVDALVMGVGAAYLLREYYAKKIDNGQIDTRTAADRWLFGVVTSALLGAAIGTVITLTNS